MPEYSEKFFEDLADRSPDKLMQLLRSGDLEPYDLTYAAEIAGRIKDRDLVIPFLLSLTNHQESIVREGAIYGLFNYLPDNLIMARLHYLLNHDSSEGVRSAATEVLANL